MVLSSLTNEKLLSWIVSLRLAKGKSLQNKQVGGSNSMRCQLEEMDDRRNKDSDQRIRTNDRQACSFNFY